MKNRLLCFACLCLAVLLLYGCSPAEPSQPSQAEAAISLLCEKTDMSEISAVDVLAQLQRAGLSAEIRMAFSTQGEESERCYRLWLPDCAVDVMLDEQGFVSLLQSGDTVYYSTVPDAASDDTPTGDEALTPSPEQPEQPPQTDAPDESSEQTTLRIVSFTSPITAGKQATLCAVGLPGVEYDISVRYASGESTAKGLENAIADENGNVSWTFRVASRVAPGTYAVTLSGGGESVSTTLVVSE